MRTANLCRVYGAGEGSVHALSDVSLQIYPKEILVILGSSGSGKSTLLHLLGGMDSPTNGTIYYENEIISSYSKKKLALYRRNQIGFVFQQYNLISDLTAKENVMMTATLSKSAMRPEEALEMVGLSHRINSYPAKLSGGEQQRVSIARAIVKKSKLLLCDEPTGALDYESGKQILELLEDLSINQGKTVVLVTHTQAIANMGNRVIHMRNGHITNEIINDCPVLAREVTW